MSFLVGYQNQFLSFHSALLLSNHVSSLSASPLAVHKQKEKTSLNTETTPLHQKLLIPAKDNQQRKNLDLIGAILEETTNDDVKLPLPPSPPSAGLKMDAPQTKLQQV